MVELDEAQLRSLYDELWAIAPQQRGAVIAAARVRSAMLYRKPGELGFEEDEAAAVRAALGGVGWE